MSDDWLRSCLRRSRLTLPHFLSRRDNYAHHFSLTQPHTRRTTVRLIARTRACSILPPPLSSNIPSSDLRASRTLQAAPLTGQYIRHTRVAVSQCLYIHYKSTIIHREGIEASAVRIDLNVSDRAGVNCDTANFDTFSVLHLCLNIQVLY